MEEEVHIQIPGKEDKETETIRNIPTSNRYVIEDSDDDFFRGEREHGNANLTETNQNQIKKINLSDKKLSKHEIQILSKGMKFTPTPERSNNQELESNIFNFHRRLRLKEFFFNKDIVNDDSLVRNKSKFQPPKGRNKVLEDYIETTKTIPTNSSTNNKHNISLQEREAIKTLANNDEIIIKEADKGICISYKIQNVSISIYRLLESPI